MVMQASGAISLADMAAEFGGATPHSASEYYLGGLVDQTYAAPYPGYWTRTGGYTGAYAQDDYHGHAPDNYLYYEGSNLFWSARGGLYPKELIYGGYYYKVDLNPKSPAGWYPVSRAVGTYTPPGATYPTAPENTGVPTSGTISFSDWYGTKNY